MYKDFTNIRQIFQKIILKGDNRNIKFILKKRLDRKPLVPSSRTFGTEPGSTLNMTEEIFLSQGKISSCYFNLG